MLVKETALSASANPKIAGVMLPSPRPLGVGVKVHWTIESADDLPIRMLDVVTLPSEEAIKFEQ